MNNNIAYIQYCIVARKQGLSILPRWVFNKLHKRLSWLKIIENQCYTKGAM